MLEHTGCVVFPFFKPGSVLFKPSTFSSFNALSSVWCCIENMFLAVANEGLACSMRIPVGTEPENVAKVLGALEGYIFPCYIGIGYPEDNALELEQIEKDVDAVTHFGKW